MSISIVETGENYLRLVSTNSLLLDSPVCVRMGSGDEISTSNITSIISQDLYVLLFEMTSIMCNLSARSFKTSSWCRRGGLVSHTCELMSANDLDKTWKNIEILFDQTRLKLRDKIPHDILSPRNAIACHSVIIQGGDGRWWIVPLKFEGLSEESKKDCLSQQSSMKLAVRWLMIQYQYNC